MKDQTYDRMSREEELNGKGGGLNAIEYMGERVIGRSDVVWGGGGRREGEEGASTCQKPS